MDENERKKLRRGVALTLVISTLLFFAALGGAYYLSREIPRMRIAKIETLLETGDTAAARTLIARVRDAAAAESYTARCDYIDAGVKLSEGDYAAARELYAAAGGYADAADMAKRCEYLAADEAFAAGDYAAAAEAFAALGGYADAADRLIECRYETALALENDGSAAEAAQIYETLGTYRDARSRLMAIAIASTGISDGDEALDVFLGLSAEEREHMLYLASVRESLPQGVLAVGFYHTVGLCADGSVLACGDDSFGQCGVSALHDAVAVAAGAYHTVVLHSDGTVSAVGRNSEHQCDTAEWRGVKAVAAADYATFGLCADGTLLCTGVNDYSEPQQWSGIAAVSGGSYNVGALRESGAVWVSPALKGVETLDGAEAVAVNTGYAVAAMADGSVRCTALELEPWRDVVALSASGTAILAIDAQGRVLSHFFRASDAVDFSAFSGVRAIAAGGTHFALLLSDGSVKVLGENEHGECETTRWQLF